MCKILYIGIHHSGKNENLRHLLIKTTPDTRSNMLPLDQQKKNGELIRFLPISAGKKQGLGCRLHLYIFPSLDLLPTAQWSMLHGVDAIVFIVDSKLEKLAQNIEYWEQFKKTLKQVSGVDSDNIIKVIQYNKRDHTSIVPINILRSELGMQFNSDEEAIASEGLGVIETLQKTTDLLWGKLLPTPKKIAKT